MQHSTALLLFAATAHALQINHIFRRPTPFLNEKNTFTEDDGYKLLEGHREKRFTVAWARDLLRPPKPGKLVLVRHGESTWNRNATFTGWTDVDLSERGEREVEHASRLLLEAGISVDVCYTSRLRRAIRSSWILLKGLDAVYRPVFKSWRLNERHYGGLTGLSKLRRPVAFRRSYVIEATRLHQTRPWVVSVPILSAFRARSRLDTYHTQASRASPKSSAKRGSRPGATVLEIDRRPCLRTIL